MSVNTYLQSLASSLVLSTSEKDSITTSVNTIKSRLDGYFSDVVEKKVFGSYFSEVPLKVRLLRDDFGRLVFLYAAKRWSLY